MAYTAQDIQKLYIAYFNRPADYFGLTFQLNAANTPGVGIERVAQGFASSPEFLTTYAGKTDAQFVDALYVNLFGRHADLDGLGFWVNLLNTGVVTKSSIALELLNGAINQDATTIANKVAAAEAFFTAIDTGVEASNYSGEKANALARDYLAGVTTDASLAAAIAPASLDATLNAIVHVNDVVPPVTTNTLTLGLDTVTGGSGADVFNGGLLNSLSAFDSLDGGAGVDTLNVLDSSGVLPGGIVVKNIENVNISTSAAGFNADVSSFTGLTTLNLTDSAQAAGAIIVNGGQSLTIASTGATTGGITVGNLTAPTGAVTISQNVTVAGGAAAAAIAVTGGSNVAISQNLTATGAGTATASDVSVTGTAATKTVTVTQSAPVTAVPGVTPTTESAAIVFNGTGLTAGQAVTIAGLTYTSTGVTTQAQLIAGFASLAAGATTGAATATGAYSGTLTAFSTSANNAGTITATSTTPNAPVADLVETDAANAINPIVITQGVAGPAVTNVSGVADGAVHIIDANAASTTAAGSITSVSLQNFGASDVNSGALASVSLSGKGTSLTVTSGNLTTATATTLALNLSGVTTTGAVALDSDYKTVNVASAVAANTVASLTGANIAALNISGDKNLTIAAQTLKSDAAITSTSTANVTLTSAIAAGQSYTGGVGVDTITLTAGGTKAIATGAGNDVVTYAGALGTGGSVDAGAGTDTLVLTAGQAVTATGATTFAGTVSNFEMLKLSAATGGATVLNMANADGINNLSIAGSTVGTLTLNNVSAAFTLTETAASSANVDVVLTNALGASDVVNLAFAADNGFTNTGMTNIAAVETINITTTDTSGDVANSAAIVTPITAAAATTVTVSGALGVSFGSSLAQTVLTSLDASGLTGTGAAGGLTFTAGALAAAASIKGGAAGTNVIDFSAATKVVTYAGGSGVDTINFAGANAQNNVLTLGDGANNFNGTNASGNNSINTGKDVDTITVGNGNNTISAGAGDDTVTVGTGNNVISLGAGADTLVLNGAGSSAAFTTIIDIGSGDKIDLNSTVFASVVGGKLGAALTSGVNDYQTFLNAAAGKGAGVVSWFQFGGDTYLVEDNSGAGSFVAGADLVVKLTGVVDLSGATLANGGHVVTIA